jgi:hypothetical protein
MKLLELDIRDDVQDIRWLKWRLEYATMGPIFGIRIMSFTRINSRIDVFISVRFLEVPMQRKKHKKDYHPKKAERAWQGYMKPTNKTLRKITEKIDLACGSMFKKVGGWFEWN